MKRLMLIGLALICSNAIAGEIIIKQKIHESLPEYEFRIEVSTSVMDEFGHYKIEKIVVSDKDGKAIQSFEKFETQEIMYFILDSTSSPAPKNIIDLITQSIINSKFISFQDANFDGYLDLGVTKWFGAHNICDNYWLYDKNTGKFMYDKELSDLSDAEFDPKTKTIYEYFGSGRHNNERKTYKFDEKGKLLLLKEEKEEYDYESPFYYKFTKELKGRKMVVTSSETIKIKK